MKSFASDNYAGVIPEVMQAIIAANEAHVISYGQDPLTAKAGDIFNELFGRDVRFMFAFNGTGANLLGLSSILKAYEAVICTSTAHLYVDESTAPELFTGARIRAVPINAFGKLEADKILPFTQRRNDVHYAQARIVSITQSTEYGTVYTPAELGVLADACHANSLYLHVDGARLLNAAVSLDISFREMLTETGVDLLTFGITKAGALGAEVVIYLNPQIGAEAAFFQKRNAQLCSKSRFIAAQFIGMLEHEAWKKYALHANKMAKLLSSQLTLFPDIRVTMPVEANAVFAVMPAGWIPQLQAIIPFYIWDEYKNEVRLMCSWDTTEEDIQLLVNSLRQLAGRV